MRTLSEKESLFVDSYVAGLNAQDATVRDSADMVDFASFTLEMPSGANLFEVRIKPVAVRREELPSKYVRREDGLMPGSPEAVEAMANAFATGRDLSNVNNVADMEEEEWD